MKNKKVKTLIVVGILVVLLSVLLILIKVGIENGHKVDGLADSEFAADNNPFLEDMGYAEAEVELDGVFTESYWEDAKPISYKNEETTTTVKAFYGENGVYIGAAIKDKDLWSLSTDTAQNSSFEIYLDKSGKGGTVSDDHMMIWIDVDEKCITTGGYDGAWGSKDIIVNYAVKLNGTINDNVEDEGYTCEVFIPYSQLGNGKEANCGFSFGTVSCANGVRDSWCCLENTNVHAPATYYILYRNTNEFKPYEKINLAKHSVDGRANESFWKGCKPANFGRGGRAEIKNYFAEDGLYFFINVMDDKLAAEGKECWQNDSAEVYIDTLGNGGEAPRKDDYQIRADVRGNTQMFVGNGSYYLETRDNVITKTLETDSGYSMEIFIPWTDMHIEKIPGTMGVTFGSVDWDGVVKEDGNRDFIWSGTFADPFKPSTYTKMTTNRIERFKKTGVLELKTPKAPASEVKLDGEFKDELWEEAELFLFSGMGVKTRYVWTDKGCYLGFDVTDDYIQTNSSYVWENSSIEVYLDYQNNDKFDAKDRVLYVDAAGNMEFRLGKEDSLTEFIGSAIQSKTKITDTGYSVEVYIPWAEFGGVRPKKMGVMFAHVRRIESKDTVISWSADGLCSENYNPSKYSDFTATEIVDVAN